MLLTQLINIFSGNAQRALFTASRRQDMHFAALSPSEGGEKGNNIIFSVLASFQLNMNYNKHVGTVIPVNELTLIANTY